MARSKYIYVVTERGWDWSEVKGVFTVKHECLSALRHLNKSALDIVRHQDGILTNGVDITDDILLQLKKLEEVAP